MAIQRWWDEFQHELFYHRRDDEAYMRHHFREEVERNLRDIIRGQRAQMATQAAIGRAQIEAIQEQAEAIERGFEQLGICRGRITSIFPRRSRKPFTCVSMSVTVTGLSEHCQS